MTRKAYKFRGNQEIEDEDGFLHEGESYRVPMMICDSAGGQQLLDALADRAADPRLSPADRVAARDELHRRYAALAVVPTSVLRNPGMFPASVREAVLEAPCAAGRDSMEAVYAAYAAHIRDAWRAGQAPAAASDSLDAAYAAYASHIRDAGGPDDRIHPRRSRRVSIRC